MPLSRDVKIPIVSHSFSTMLTLTLIPINQLTQQQLPQPIRLHIPMMNNINQPTIPSTIIHHLLARAILPIYPPPLTPDPKGLFCPRTETDFLDDGRSDDFLPRESTPSNSIRGILLADIEFRV